MLACVRGFREAALLLLKAGADADAKDAFGGTAMCADGRGGGGGISQAAVLAEAAGAHPGKVRWLLQKHVLPAGEPIACILCSWFALMRHHPLPSGPCPAPHMHRWEACQHGQDECIDLLLRFGGR